MSDLRASDLLDLADAFQDGEPGDALDNALHEILPEPKVVQPPRYSRSVDAAVGALRSIFPAADWRKFTPASFTVYAASPYNAAAQVRFDGIGRADGARLCAAFLKMWANRVAATEARARATQ